MTEQEFLASDDPTWMLEWFSVRQQPREPWHVSDRKLRLWACACWRACPPRNLTVGWHDALNELEEVAEGQRQVFSWASQGYICAITNIADMLRMLSGLWLGENLSKQQRQRNAQVCCDLLRAIVGNPWWPVMLPKTKRKCLACNQWTDCRWCKNTRELPGNECPWLTWKDGTVPKMAQAIYDERRWGDMGMLADALEESGCRDEVILRWCRGQERCPRCLGEGGWEEDMGGVTPWGDSVSQWVVCDYPCTLVRGWIPRRGPSVRGDWCLDLLTGRERPC